MQRVPLVDIARFDAGSAEEKRGIARTFDATCRDIGFLVIQGHGVPLALQAAAFDALRGFFALPHEIKHEACATADRVRGWRAFGATALARTRGDDTPPDLMERFTVGAFDRSSDDMARLRNSFLAPNRWPASVPGLKQALERYYLAMEQLANRLMRIAALALDLPEHHFVPYFDRHITVQIANFYPCPPGETAPGQQRAGKHTDYNSMTILAPDPQAAGLQVEDDTGQWLDVPHVPDTFVINIGDLMARWTNDRWVSTMHRVALPAGGQPASDRLSIAYFHQPNDDAEIACLPTCAAGGAKYAPVRSGEYLAEKVNRGWIGNKERAYAV